MTYILQHIATALATSTPAPPMWECNVRRICYHIMFDMDEFTCFGWPTTNDDFKLQLTIFPPFWEGGWFLNQENRKKPFYDLLLSPSLLLETLFSVSRIPNRHIKCFARMYCKAFFTCSNLLFCRRPWRCFKQKSDPFRRLGHPGKTPKIWQVHSHHLFKNKML